MIPCSCLLIKGVLRILHRDISTFPPRGMHHFMDTFDLLPLGLCLQLFSHNASLNSSTNWYIVVFSIAVQSWLWIQHTSIYIFQAKPKRRLRANIAWDFKHLCVIDSLTQNLNQKPHPPNLNLQLISQRGISTELACHNLHIYSLHMYITLTPETSLSTTIQ